MKVIKWKSIDDFIFQSLHVQMNARILQFFKPYVSTLGVETAIRWFETLHGQIIKGEA